MTNKRLTIETSGATINIIERDRFTETWRDYDKKPRCYVWGDVEFNAIEDLNNRTRRPHAVWRKGLIQAFVEAPLLFDTGEMRWYQYAGCSCPCSPGFILPHLTLDLGDDGIFRRYDLNVTLHGAPTVDETKSGRLFADA